MVPSSLLWLSLLPCFVFAGGVHRLPLTKVKRESAHHGYEAQALAQKYGSQQPMQNGHQVPLEST